MEQKINWFPGHMKKADEAIRQRLKTVDLIIEVLDARATTATANPVVQTFNRPVLQIALKSDLAPSNQATTILTGSIKNKNFRKQIIDQMDAILADKIQKYKQKKLQNPKFLVLVVGLPNVGKSSLINFLKQRKQLQAENRPGVTKAQAISKINDRYSLIDTPGIMFKKIDAFTTGAILTLIRCIKKEVVPLDTVCQVAFNALPPEIFQTFYDLPNQPVDFPDLLQKICQRQNFYQQNHECDTERALQDFYEAFSNGRIGKINWNDLQSKN